MFPDHDAPSGERNADRSLDDRFLHRALLAVPDVRHIPAFALAVERSRAVAEATVLSDFDALSTPIDQNVAQALQAGRYGAFHLIGTRTRLDPQTALYALWVAFLSAERGQAFKRDHPHLGLTGLTTCTEAALRDAEASGEQPEPSIAALRSQCRALQQLRSTTIIMSGDELSADLSRCSP